MPDSDYPDDGATYVAVASRQRGSRRFFFGREMKNKKPPEEPGQVVPLNSSMERIRRVGVPFSATHNREVGGDFSLVGSGLRRVIRNV